MKRTFVVLSAISFIFITVSAIVKTQNAAASSEKIIEIKEKFFITQTNEIYYNADDYLGKIIKYEGIFDIYEIPETGIKRYLVLRYGPGCCGNDSMAGFEVVWDKKYPNKHDWVEVSGVLEQYEEDGVHYLRLAVISLTALPRRGKETVLR
jgi:uncharacterized membrane protein YcgQ (UPF0703/DUF1980 family)